VGYRSGFLSSRDFLLETGTIWVWTREAKELWNASKTNLKAFAAYPNFLRAHPADGGRSSRLTGTTWAIPTLRSSDTWISGRVGSLARESCGL
jgi:hypothetical protein